MHIPSAFKAGFVISLILSIVLSFADPACAKTSASPPTAQTPALTPEQQKYKAARDKCLQRYVDEKIPRSQTHTFLSACIKDAGFKKAVPLPHPQLAPPQQGK